MHRLCYKIYLFISVTCLMQSIEPEERKITGKCVFWRAFLPNWDANNLKEKCTQVTAEDYFMSFIKILSKAMGVFQRIPVGFGAGQYLGRLVPGLHHMTRPEPMALSSNCRNTTLVKAVLVVLHWPILSNLAKLDQQYSHPFRIKKGYFFNILSNFQTLTQAGW